MEEITTTVTRNMVNMELLINQKLHIYDIMYTRLQYKCCLQTTLHIIHKFYISEMFFLNNTVILYNVTHQWIFSHLQCPTSILIILQMNIMTPNITFQVNSICGNIIIVQSEYKETPPQIWKLSIYTHNKQIMKQYQHYCKKNIFTKTFFIHIWILQKL